MTREEQAREQLINANQIRSKHARALKLLRTGKLSPSKFLDDDDLGRVRVGRFLGNVPVSKTRTNGSTSYGIRVRRVLGEASFSPYKRLGALGALERKWLLRQIESFPYFKSSR